MTPPEGLASVSNDLEKNLAALAVKLKDSNSTIGSKLAGTVDPDAKAARLMITRNKSIVTDLDKRIEEVGKCHAIRRELLMNGVPSV